MALLVIRQHHFSTVLNKVTSYVTQCVLAGISSWVPRTSGLDMYLIQSHGGFAFMAHRISHFLQQLEHYAALAHGLLHSAGFTKGFGRLINSDYGS